MNEVYVNKSEIQFTIELRLRIFRFNIIEKERKKRNENKNSYLNTRRANLLTGFMQTNASSKWTSINYLPSAVAAICNSVLNKNWSAQLSSWNIHWNWMFCVVILLIFRCYIAKYECWCSSKNYSYVQPTFSTHFNEIRIDVNEIWSQ